MGIVGEISSVLLQGGLQGPQTVYLFPAATTSRPDPKEVLHFQYWPQSLQDDYQVEYAEHAIPGGSHPLYQWVSGRGRTITFQAVFTSEVNTSRLAGTQPFAVAGTTTLANVSSAITPSAPFTVDVAAALSRLRSWMRASYNAGGLLGLTSAPQILTLVIPGTKLNGKTDSVNVILRSAPITIESWFPDGQIRVATVDLTFSEIIQHANTTSEGAGSSVKFTGREGFASAAANYQFRGLADSSSIGGSQ